MKTVTTKAIVLRNFNLKESDKLYTLFTRQLGKLAVRAYGVRKISSKRAGNLDSLNYIEASLVSSGDFYSLGEVKLLDSFQHLKKDYKKVLYGTYIAELVLRNIEDNVLEVGVFDALVEVLHRLDSGKNGALLYVHCFEVQFLEQMGYKIPVTAPISPIALSVIEQLSRNKVVPEDYVACKVELDKFLKDYITQNLDIKLKTLDFF